MDILRKVNAILNGPIYWVTWPGSELRTEHTLFAPIFTIPASETSTYFPFRFRQLLIQVYI